MRALIVWISLCSLLLAGCGSTSPALPLAPPIPDQGRILYKGKPLTQGEIKLDPTDGGARAHGAIQPDGTFTLTTFQEGDGALLGVHSVSVSGTDRTVQTKKEAHVRITEGKADYNIDLK